MKDKKLEKWEIIARHSGPVTVLKWLDNRNVTMVSTYHSADTQTVTNKGKETEKPLCVIDYNHNMGGVDLKDQLLHMFMVERGKKCLNGTSNFSKGYSTLQFSIRLFIDK